MAVFTTGIDPDTKKRYLRDDTGTTVALFETHMEGKIAFCMMLVAFSKTGTVEVWDDSTARYLADATHANLKMCDLKEKAWEISL